MIHTGPVSSKFMYPFDKLRPAPEIDVFLDSE
jgi:hypothetical protein